MELIRCPRCAKEIPDVSRFCRRCGTSMGWGLAEGMSPAWSDSSAAGVFTDIPVTLASKPEPAPPPKPRWEPATLQGANRRKAQPKRCNNGGGGAWAASIMLGVAAMTFLSHVHRMATRPMTPATPVSPRLLFPPQFQTSPVRSAPAPMRGVSRGIPDDAIDWRFTPPPSPNIETPAPPVIVRPAPPRGWQRSASEGRREYRGWEDREAERARDSRGD
jgi:hypothetical protein